MSEKLQLELSKAYARLVHSKCEVGSIVPNPFLLRSSSLGNLVERVKQLGTLAVSAVIGNIFSAIFTFCFALVGTSLGALTGALIGQETESGFIRGAAVGAISGTVFSIEVFELSLVLWQFDESGIGCMLYLESLLSFQGLVDV
ncbi:NEP1-interacting protein 2-like [Vigna umbellata]|uniref:NEP1-interacting protein 2-like n=1 Tax=Vigna umbellata TaxID=87088 RepID=UPI001F5EB88E|nr:NEP1-interacting protein 2-like [Vigna umbellata]